MLRYKLTIFLIENQFIVLLFLKFIIFLMTKYCIDNTIVFLSLEVTGCSESDKPGYKNVCRDHYYVNEKKTQTQRDTSSILVRAQECLSGGWSGQATKTTSVDEDGKVTVSSLMSFSKREGDNMFGFGGERIVQSEGAGCIRLDAVSDAEVAAAAQEAETRAKLNMEEDLKLKKESKKK